MSRGLKFYISKGLRKYLNPPAIRDCNFDPTVKIWDHSTIDGTTIGKYTYVSDHTLISDCDIGAFCSISSYCQIGGASHPMNFVSTSPIFVQGHNPWDKHLGNLEYQAYKKTVIGNDVWIGSHVLISGGISIGDGAVIGMGSVVTHNVEPYSVVAGVPAKEIRKRFDNQTIEWLKMIKWWEWPDTKLKRLSKYFIDPVELMEELEKRNG